MLRHIVALCIPLIVALSYFLSTARPVGHPTYYSDSVWNGDAPAAKASKPAAPPAKNDNDSLRDLFHRRLEQYRARCDELSNNIYYWVLLVGLTVLVLAQQKTEPYEIFGIPIPVSATHMLIVVSMLYLWIDFGSTLKFLIYERMALWKLVDAIEGPVSADRSVGIASLRPLLHGKSFLDGWFVTFLPEFSLRWVSAGAGSYRAVNHVLNAFIWGTGAAMIPSPSPRPDPFTLRPLHLHRSSFTLHGSVRSPLGVTAALLLG